MRIKKNREGFDNKPKTESRGRLVFKHACKERTKAKRLETSAHPLLHERSQKNTRQALQGNTRLINHNVLGKGPRLMVEDTRTPEKTEMEEVPLEGAASWF